MNGYETGSRQQYKTAGYGDEESTTEFLTQGTQILFEYWSIVVLLILLLSPNK